jgi:hypothetical protein
MRSPSIWVNGWGRRAGVASDAGRQMTVFFGLPS